MPEEAPPPPKKTSRCSVPNCEQRFEAFTLEEIIVQQRAHFMVHQARGEGQNGAPAKGCC